MPKRPTDRHADVGIPSAAAPISALILCDRLIQVAQDADRAGYSQTASHLVALVDHMFDGPPQRH
jgi:hypothetical protein